MVAASATSCSAGYDACKKGDRVKTFKYLGLTLAEDGELDAEVIHRVSSDFTFSCASICRE